MKSLSVLFLFLLCLGQAYGESEQGEHVFQCKFTSKALLDSSMETTQIVEIKKNKDELKMSLDGENFSTKVILHENLTIREDLEQYLDSQNLNIGEKALASAMKLESANVESFNFTSGLNLKEVRTVSVYQAFDILVNGEGITFFVKAYDKEGDYLGSFLSSLILAKCE